MNSYWKNDTGQLAKLEDSQVELQMEALGWKRIGRDEYRKRLRTRAHEQARDHRAQGEHADEVNE